MEKPKTKKGRDNFSQAVLKILCRRAGGKCCKCGAATLGPVKNQPLQTVNIGKGAHIAAAAPGGPRYDAKMNAAERSSATNGMWLCSNCHDTIDRDPLTYPTPALKKMKKDAEDRIRLELGVATINPTGQFAESQLVTSVSAVAILEIRKVKAKYLEGLEEDPDESADLALKGVGFLNFEEDLYTQDVAWELLALLREITMHMHSSAQLVSLEVIRWLDSMMECFAAKWERKDVELLCMVIKAAMPKHKRSKVYQSGMALLKDLALNKALKEKKLHQIPLDVIRRQHGGGKDYIDAPDAKRPHLLTQQEEDADDKYHQLMLDLASSSDTKQIPEIERQIEEMGCETNVQ